MRQFAGFYILLFIAAATVSGCRTNGENNKSGEAVEVSHAIADVYTCPMHPSVRSNKPGVCPICHMTLVKVSSGNSDTSSSLPKESVALSTSKQVLANISTQPAMSKILTQEITLAGKIDYPEPNAQQITTRYAGRIEHLYASYVGQEVRRGDRIADLYSPDAIAAQREFLIALYASDQNQLNAERASDSSVDLRSQSRSKLKLWGFTDGQIDTLAYTKIVRTIVTVYSPISGTIMRKNVDLQSYIAAGDPLFEVADLRKVWLQLDAYESDLPSIRIGAPLTAQIDAFPSETFQGTISFVGAVVEPSTRTVRIRATLENKSMKLKPQMFAHGVIHIRLTKSVVVPASAVIENGKRTVVWVAVGQGRFEPRIVSLGLRAGDMYQVLDGLREGEMIAVSGGYLIDSESQLQRAATGNPGQ